MIAAKASGMSHDSCVPVGRPHAGRRGRAHAPIPNRRSDGAQGALLDTWRIGLMIMPKIANVCA